MSTVRPSVQRTLPPGRRRDRQTRGSGERSSTTHDADSSMDAYRATVPQGITPGSEFYVYIRDRVIRVVCPHGSGPGDRVLINVASDARSDSNSVRRNEDRDRLNPHPRTQQSGTQTNPLAAPQIPRQNPDPHYFSNRDHNSRRSTQLFEVEVPHGVQPGAPFPLLADGARVLVTCPINAYPGQKIRFTLPQEFLQQKLKPQKGPAAIRLFYDKDGWSRRIRVSDMKFQWIRVDEQGDLDYRERFDMAHSAYVRKLTRTRNGSLDISLVPASEATTDSRIKDCDGQQIVSYSDIATAQIKPYEEKEHWFQETCSRLCIEWSTGHMKINVRRARLLSDSIDAIMSMKRRDLRKVWRFEFINEDGMDAGGLKREWFHLITNQIFDPEFGLWQFGTANQMSMQINPSSGVCCADHLMYFRFLGRVLGKALMDREVCTNHMTQYLYKHFLGWPVTFADLEMVDEEYYKSLKKLKDLVQAGEDLSMLCLDFTTNQDAFGTKQEMDLVPGGADIALTNDNFPEYLEACVKYKLLDAVKPQLNELLMGFYEVIPDPLLTVFDFQEFELLLCGLPKIDIDDWKRHTLYVNQDSNLFDAKHPVCRWFWEVVTDFDQEMKACLLQFVTGTSGVPPRGFAVLQGNDGNICKFTIQGVPVRQCLYPRAHTCFNRLDLPMYRTKEELQEKLQVAVTMCATGFDIE